MAAEPTIETTQYLTFKPSCSHWTSVRVREVLDFTTITKVPQIPDYMRGVINLRGSVVPVVDLRLKFGMTMAEKTVNTCVIIVEVDMDGERVVMGAMADAVQDGTRSGTRADRAATSHRHQAEDRLHKRVRPATARTEGQGPWRSDIPRACRSPSGIRQRRDDSSSATRPRAR